MVLPLSSKLICAFSAGAAVAWALKCATSKENPLKAATSFVKWNHNWDRRDVSSLIKPNKKKEVSDEEMEKKKAELKPTATRHIFLVRHGDYYLNREKEEERKLTPLGLEQADLVGQRLKDLNLNFSRIIRSSFTRAKETSKEIEKYFPDVTVETNDMLIEGLPIETEPPNYFDPIKIHEDGPRIEGAFRKYFHRADASQKTDSYEIIVSHGTVIRYCLLRALQAPPEFWMRFKLFHCSISRISIDPDGYVQVHGAGDIGFMPVDSMSYK
ncbi:hypothetical protein TNIN_22781 [Trichonephila inaurata madagascariensis]|uniref:Serine/threonine-protein phosphatase PGAM5, mitochondrial n=1 Tax=Trichonephila inaurata madagascariensis TaxID=2747483 RepID=A0A8X6YNB6_9ARAC|nr:hypothetical protein TNIN_168171 [Trichonephila inaurata madagascariensis]GFY73978.1 hypothetical protein TNIN_22781 [Trichonephila inaurata madagascariensis]